VATPKLPWLTSLEERVREALDRLRATESANRRLSARVEELEARLAAAGGDPSAVDEAAWRAERSEVRERVEALTETLESLLDEG
jgi:polyhydroxyalkanoate synthesis regulator phasin